jgi:hypothetical protein
MDVIYCCDEGVFGHALVYGTTYTIFEHDALKRQVRVKGKNGPFRWFPGYCFSVSPPPELDFVVMRRLGDDPLEVDVFFKNRPAGAGLSRRPVSPSFCAPLLFWG